MRNPFLQRKYPQYAVQADPLRKRSFMQPLTENYPAATALYGGGFLDSFRDGNCLSAFSVPLLPKPLIRAN